MIKPGKITDRNTGKWLAALLIVVMLAPGCVRRPKGVASDKDMAPVLADMELAEAYLQTQSPSGDRDKIRRELTNGILEKYGMSNETFDSTMSWYSRNVDAYSKLDMMVTRELESRKRVMDRKSKKGPGAEYVPQNDIWPYTRMVMMSEQSGSDILPFSIPTGATKPGYTYEWKMRVRLGADLSLLMGVEYDDGTISYRRQAFNGDRKITLTLQTDTARKPHRLFGQVMMKRRTEMPLWIDSISLSSLPYDSTNYYRIQSQRMYRRPARPRKTVPADTITAGKDSIATQK